MFKRFITYDNTKKDVEKPELSVIPLHPHSKPQITSLGQRLEDVVNEYCEQEHKAGRMVTYAEIIGTVEMLKDRLKP